tara:strand:+ start:197 stop:397 length:201 start_codon:yes stop_codon:yes gene_type:complete
MNHERGLNMIIHASLFAIVCFIFMRFSLNLSQSKSEDRSIALGALVLLYMLLFGHRLPTRINQNLL